MGDTSLEVLNNIEVTGRKAVSPIRETEDITEGQMWLGRDGSLVAMDWFTAMSMEGRVFNVALNAPDTTMTGETAYDATHPSILIDIPDGVTFIPVHLDICYEDAAGTDNYIIVGADDVALYSSGGTGTKVSTCNNIRTDNPHASAVTAVYTGDNQLTITDPGATERILFSYVNAFADATTSPPIQVIWEPKSPPVLVGPASFFVYCYGSTAPEFSFSVQWVELPKDATT